MVRRDLDSNDNRPDVRQNVRDIFCRRSHVKYMSENLADFLLDIEPTMLPYLTLYKLFIFLKYIRLVLDVI